jgi:hypothetical protein
MGNSLAYEVGLIKYIIFTPLTLTGFISMYIFGSGIWAAISGIQAYSETENLIDAILRYFIVEYLPPTSIEGVVMQTGTGAVVAGLLWYSNVPKQGN